MNGKQITVTGRDDLGYSPHFGFEIRKDESYTINAADFNPELFDQPVKTATYPKGGDDHE
jgi:hypothetical protein